MALSEGDLSRSAFARRVQCDLEPEDAAKIVEGMKTNPGRTISEIFSSKKPEDANADAHMGPGSVTPEIGKDGKPIWRHPSTRRDRDMRQ